MASKHDITKAGESVVMKALRLMLTDRPALRFLAGQYRAALIGKMQSFPLVKQKETDRTSGEAHHYQYGYGRGYAEGVQATMTLMAGEEATRMFTAWAEPFDLPKEEEGISDAASQAEDQ